MTPAVVNVDESMATSQIYFLYMFIFHTTVRHVLYCPNAAFSFYVDWSLVKGDFLPKSPQRRADIQVL